MIPAPRAPGAGPPASTRILTLYPDVRDQQVAALEAVYQREFEAAEPEWRHLLRELGLELWYYVAARLVIDDGVWREKAQPYAYVAAITRRKAERLGLAEDRIEMVDITDYPDAEDVAFPFTLMDDVGPRWLLPEGKPGMRVDWDGIAQAAGLDDGEREVLQARSQGISRTVMLDGINNEQARLRCQAAWRRLSAKVPDLRNVIGVRRR